MFDRTVQFFVLVAITGAFVAAPARAAKLQNTDAEPRVVTVTEDGVRVEVQLEPTTTVEACARGCFITLPDGAMMPLTGSETVVIEAGEARIAP